MSKFLETNIDSPNDVTDVAELVTGEQIPLKAKRNKWNDHATYFLKETKKEPEEKNYEWVYRNYERFGNVYVSNKTLKEIDLERLGDFKKVPSFNEIKREIDGYVLWKIQK